MFAVESPFHHHQFFKIWVGFDSIELWSSKWLAFQNLIFFLFAMTNSFHGVWKEFKKKKNSIDDVRPNEVGVKDVAVVWDRTRFTTTMLLLLLLLLFMSLYFRSVRVVRYEPPRIPKDPERVAKNCLENVVTFDRIPKNPEGSLWNRLQCSKK